MPGVVAFVALQRIAELLYARANTRRLLAAGGVEAGSGHYPLLVAVHAAWLAAVVLAVPVDAAVQPVFLFAFVVLQAARFWVIATLGPRWTTRIIVVPGESLVRDGPYRFVRHPNYWIVAGEIAALPLTFGAWGVALVFSVLNALVLGRRIRVEERALGLR